MHGICPGDFMENRGISCNTVSSNASRCHVVPRASVDDPVAFGPKAHRHTDLKSSSCPHVGLSTSCSRFPQKLPVISQKVAQKLLQKVQSCFLYMLLMEVSQKLLKNIFLLLLSSFIWSDANICKLYNKSKISKQKMYE